MGSFSHKLLLTYLIIKGQQVWTLRLDNSQIINNLPKEPSSLEVCNRLYEAVLKQTQWSTK